MQSSSRVALNTGVLYGRMLITMGITLYSTRLVLNALGSTDYGTFNLIAGVISMLSFLNNAMATSTQRFLSFNQGKQDLSQQKKIFSNSLSLHILLGIIIVIGLESSGFFLLNDFLNIPSTSLNAAKAIYHFMSITVFFTIVSVPFTGSLVAHENMIWIAVVSVVETFLKLAIALYLSELQSDRLMIYGLLTACISVVSFFLNLIYCSKKYPECSFRTILNIDKVLIKQLTSFTGWNLFGTLCSLGRTQGLAVLLNLFFGTIINAAYGVAGQISAQLNFLSSTMLRAVNPQIMKSEGANNRTRMLRISMMASKFGFFLLALFAIPCLFEMHSILILWLKNVPDYTVMFCSLILIGNLINQLTIGIQSALQAIGNIKYYQIVVGVVVLLNLPIAYCLLKIGYPPYAVLISYIAIELIACSLRLYFIVRLSNLSVAEYFENVIFKEVPPVAITLFACYIVTTYIHIEFRFAVTGLISTVTFLTSIYYFGLCKDEKIILTGLLQKLHTRILSVSSI